MRDVDIEFDFQSHIRSNVIIQTPVGYHAKFRCYLRLKSLDIIWFKIRNVHAYHKPNRKFRRADVSSHQN